MKRLKPELSYTIYILLVAVFFLSCNTGKELTYKRLDYEKQFKKSGLCGNATIIMKQDGMVLLKDMTGWIEQTYYKPFILNHNIGDEVFIKHCY
jgi:hypothetical protein